MSRLRYLNPLRLRRAAEELRRLRAGGGPRLLRLVRVSEPRGLIVPTVELELELEARDSTLTRVDAPVPLPWALAWGYRLARAAGTPYVASIDHTRRVGIAIPLPRLPGL